VQGPQEEANTDGTTEVDRINIMDKQEEVQHWVKVNVRRINLPATAATEKQHNRFMCSKNVGS